MNETRHFVVMKQTERTKDRRKEKAGETVSDKICRYRSLYYGMWYR